MNSLDEMVKQATIFCRLEQYPMYSILSDTLGRQPAFVKTSTGCAPRRPDSHHTTGYDVANEALWSRGVKSLEDLKRMLAQASKSSKSPPCCGRHLVDTAALKS